MKAITPFERNCNNCAWQIMLGDDCSCIKEDHDIKATLPKGHVALECMKVVCADWNHFEIKDKEYGHKEWCAKHLTTVVDHFWAETIGTSEITYV